MTAPLHLALASPLAGDAMEGAREWLRHALHRHADAPIVLELGCTAAADETAMRLLAEAGRALDAGADLGR